MERRLQVQEYLDYARSAKQLLEKVATGNKSSRSTVRATKTYSLAAWTAKTHAPCAGPDVRASWKTQRVELLAAGQPALGNNGGPLALDVDVDSWLVQFFHAQHIRGAKVVTGRDIDLRSDVPVPHRQCCRTPVHPFEPSAQCVGGAICACLAQRSAIACQNQLRFGSLMILVVTGGHLDKHPSGDHPASRKQQ